MSFIDDLKNKFGQGDALSLQDLISRMKGDQPAPVIPRPAAPQDMGGFNAVQQYLNEQSNPRLDNQSYMDQSVQPVPRKELTEYLQPTVQKNMTSVEDDDTERNINNLRPTKLDKSVYAPKPKLEATPSKDAQIPEDDKQAIANDPDKKFEDQYAKEEENALNASSMIADADINDLLQQEEQPSQSAPSEAVAASKSPTLSERFKAAQDAKANAEDSAIWAKIGARLGGALGHQSADVIKGNEELADVVAKRGSRQMDQLQQEIAFQKQDPDSEYSRKAKDFLSQQFQIDPSKLAGLSVEQLDQTFMGPALKAFEADQSRQSKESIAEENRLSRESLATEARLSREQQANIARQERELKNKELNVYRDKMLGDRNERFYEGQLKSVVNKAMAPVNNADKLNEARLYNSSNIFMTAGINPDDIKTEHDIDKLDRKELDKIPIPQVVELGIEAAKTLGGGNPAVSTINKLVPNNLNMSQAQIAGFISSKLKPAQQADVIKAYVKLAHRLRETSKAHVKKRLDAAFSGNEKIKSFNPEDYEAAKEATYSKYGLTSSKKQDSNKLMDKIPNAMDLNKTFESIDGMSEEDLDKELARRGLK